MFKGISTSSERMRKQISCCVIHWVSSSHERLKYHHSFCHFEFFQPCWWMTSCSRGWPMGRPVWTNLWSSLAPQTPLFLSTTTPLQRRWPSGSEGRASVSREWRHVCWLQSSLHTGQCCQYDVICLLKGQTPRAPSFSTDSLKSNELDHDFLS